MRRTTTLATLAAALAATLGAAAVPAQAAVTSASINDLTATLNLDGANDNVTVSVSGGVLAHGQTTGGLASGSTGTAPRTVSRRCRPTARAP